MIPYALFLILPRYHSSFWIISPHSSRRWGTIRALSPIIFTVARNNISPSPPPPPATVAAATPVVLRGKRPSDASTADSIDSIGRSVGLRGTPRQHHGEACILYSNPGKIALPDLKIVPHPWWVVLFDSWDVKKNIFSNFSNPFQFLFIIIDRRIDLYFSVFFCFFPQNQLRRLHQLGTRPRGQFGSVHTSGDRSGRPPTPVSALEV